MSPRNPSDEALIPDIMVFGGGAFERQLSVNGDGTSMIGLVSL